MHSGQIGSNDRFGFEQIYRKRGCCYAPPELGGVMTKRLCPFDGKHQLGISKLTAVFGS